MLLAPHLNLPVGDQIPRSCGTKFNFLGSATTVQGLVWWVSPFRVIGVLMYGFINPFTCKNSQAVHKNSVTTVQTARYITKNLLVDLLTKLLHTSLAVPCYRMEWGWPVRLGLGGCYLQLPREKPEAIVGAPQRYLINSTETGLSAITGLDHGVIAFSYSVWNTNFWLGIYRFTDLIQEITARYAYNLKQLINNWVFPWQQCMNNWLPF